MKESRRHFVTALTSAGASLSLPISTLATAAHRQPLKLVVLADMHLGYKTSEAAEHLWKRTAAEIAAIDAGLVLNLGDHYDLNRALSPIQSRAA